MVEKRFTDHSGCKIEKREDGKRILNGYGAVFYDQSNPGTQYQLWDNVFERIAPTAFNRVISESQDVRGLFNHDSNMVLGRTGAGTMRLYVDMRGLRYEIDLPDTAVANDLATLVERGDVDGSSFGFIVRGQERKYGKDGEPDVRIITDVDLFDTGPVTFPAYDATTAGVRSAIFRATAADSAEVEAMKEAWNRGKEIHYRSVEAKRNYEIAKRKA